MPNSQEVLALLICQTHKIFTKKFPTVFICPIHKFLTYLSCQITCFSLKDSSHFPMFLTFIICLLSKVLIKRFPYFSYSTKGFFTLVICPDINHYEVVMKMVSRTSQLINSLGLHKRVSHNGHYNS